MNQIKVGCCGFPKARKHYFREFKLVEIQRTFYSPPSIDRAAKWREEAPQDFEFSLKAWQLITHLPSSPTYRKAGLQIPSGKEKDYGFFRPSKEVFQSWEKTRDVALTLRSKVIVFQCPAKFTENLENIANMRCFFATIERRDFIFVWEPRGNWNDEIIKALCSDLDLVRCVNPLERPALYGKTGYFRLHGGRDYRHEYTDDELRSLLKLTGDEAYVLLNNISMYHDASRLKEPIESRG
jgi:uncharacterized protein YecE (DUF72 family)